MEHPNKYVIVKVLSVLLAVLAFQACYYDNEEELYPFNLGDCDTLTTVTYSNSIEAITATNCAISGCHTGVNPSGGLLLETYAQVSQAALSGELENRVVINKNMPPSGPLPNCEIEAIRKWIDAGAPEF